jgi:amino acid adenylation domain-containing protein
VEFRTGRSIDEPPGFVPFTVSDTEQSIAARFDAIARLWPERLAVGFGGARWTYRTLARAADRVAHDLLTTVNRPAQPVAVLVSQGPDLLAAILGILKSGHFYVPLDVAQPAEALRRIVDDAGAPVMVVDRAGQARAVPLPSGMRTIAIHELADPVDPPSPRPIRPDDLACVYYTSGSTGGPKGVTDTHRNVLHNVLRYTNGLKICAGDRLTLLQGPAFSGVMSSQFGALLNGAAVFPFDIPSQGMSAIGAWLIRERITIYHSVPAIFRRMLRATPEDRVYPHVRVVRLEGDAATHTDVTLFRQHFGDGAVLAHGLGATECGLVRRFVLGRDTRLESGTVPIGYPVEDVTIRIVDERGREQARGEVGEITVESRYLSPGYWKRPDLTAAAFTEGASPGTRLYRTGDLGSMHQDGCVEYLGRRDGQPKVRGQRVDVEGIEAALAGTGLVREAAVVVRSCAGGAERLVAYVVPIDIRNPRVTVIRRRLVAVLPAQNLPARFVVLEALPTTTNHKLDRGRLPPPETSRPELDVPFLAPRSDFEAATATAWAETLGLDQIGVADDFFELGGDSLDAAAVLPHLSSAFGRELPALSVFEHPTVELFARALDAALDGRAPTSAGARAPGSALVRVQPHGSRPPFFFLHAEYGGDGFYCLNVARHIGADQPFLGLSPFGRDGDPVPRTIEDMAARYIQIVRAEQPSGPYSLGGFCSCAIVAWEMARQLRESGADVALLVLIEPPPTRTGIVARARHEIARALRPIKAVLGPTDRARPTDASKDDDRRAAIARIYSRAVEGYVPRGFDGPVLLLQTDDEADTASLDAWRRVSKHLTAVRIPGDHNSCIIRHARTLGSTLSSRLAAAPVS